MKPFNWHSETISDATLIDQGYRNTQNVRRYFKSRCGEHFKFDRDFMLWMKDNIGKSMGDAVAEWIRSRSQ